MEEPGRLQSMESQRCMSESVLPMFSSRSFIVSGLMFRSLIHFEFIFAFIFNILEGGS